MKCLEITVIDEFIPMWNDKSSGGHYSGAYYRPDPPAGFHSLGDLGQSNHNPPTPTPSSIGVKALVPDALAPPKEFHLIWKDSGSGAHLSGSFWRPIPPTGYRALGLVAQKDHNAPSPDCMMCVKEEYLVEGELSALIWSDAGTGADASFGSWKVVSSNDKALISATFSGQASHTKPTSCDEAWALNLDYVEVPDPSLISANSIQFCQGVKQISFNKGGFPLDYHSIFGIRLQHCQDMIRLPNDASGNRYYMGTYSQNVNDTEGGMVFVARRDKENGGKVIWCDVLNNGHLAGGCNHPGDLRRIGNIVVIAGQNWNRDLLTDGVNIGGGAAAGAAAGAWAGLVGAAIGAGIGAIIGDETEPADPMGRGNGGQNILFYDVSHPKAPKYLGRLNTFLNKDANWISLDTDIDLITLNYADNWYYMAFNGIKSTGGMVCRARTLSPNACWTFVRKGNLGSPSPIKIEGGVMMAAETEAKDAIQLTPFPYGDNPSAEKSGTFPKTKFGSKTTFSVNTLADGKSYVVRTNVESDDTIEIEEIEST